MLLLFAFHRQVKLDSMFILVLMVFQTFAFSHEKCDFGYFHCFNKDHLREAISEDDTMDGRIMTCAQRCLVKRNCSGIYFRVDGSVCGHLGQKLSEEGDTIDASYITTSASIWPSRLVYQALDSTKVVPAIKMKKAYSQPDNDEQSNMTSVRCKMEGHGQFKFHAPTRQCLFYQRHPQNWNAAREACRRIPQGDLAILETDARYNGLKAWLGQNGLTRGFLTTPGLWYGLEVTNNTWYWANRALCNWEPSFKYPPHNGSCMFMKDGPFHATLSAPCTTRKPSVCEIR